MIYQTTRSALVMLMLAGATHAGVHLDAARLIEEAVAREYAEAAAETQLRSASARIRQMKRTQTGVHNRQELHVGGQHGSVVVDRLMQKQSGVGNHQSMSLGAVNDR